MSDINEMVFLEQVQKQTVLDQKIQNIKNQRLHLDQLLPFHKNNIDNQNSNNKKEKIKVYEMPTKKDLKMAKHFEKMATRITDFSKPLI